MNIIYALLGAFSGLPGWTRWVFVGLSLAVTLGLSSFFDSKVGIIITVGVVGVGCLVALLWAVVKKRREKRAAAFGGDLQQQSAATPGGISDPARRARLEDLRRNFEKGVETFRAAGKNLYDVPWYVIVGEPGAGKTEAIRHSNVGFPPGMQDEFQGVGGTINMNWWFTNDAVILDTAGRLLFEEVEAGSTSEWRIFLEMLKKHRPNCPINGLILAIPAESLVKDTPEQIQKKAGKIATQLETIQKKLDVRFPAYVVITKCDLLNGFREFFDNLTDPQAQHQMMGWSNPDPLDAPFRVDLVDEHIHTVVERLRRRRQGLMLDPVARLEQRRADEVDRLFSLPHSVSLIAPNLRQYLQAIFIEGVWSVQPLFLRGIYFTSSLREGSALDQELASALGLDVESLPEGKAWERESSFFLRDVFVEKTFRERGLVTRATNTSQLVLKRRMMLLGTSIAAGLAVLGLSLYGHQSLKNRIRNEAGYWARAADFWERKGPKLVSPEEYNKTLTPIVTGSDPKAMAYAGGQPIGKGTSKSSELHFSDTKLPLADFHQKLANLADTPLQVSKIFRLAQDFNLDTARKPAQAVMFEDAVLKPLLDAAREKMKTDVNFDRTTELSRQREADALLALIRLEAAVVKRRENLPPGPFAGGEFAPPLFRYISGETFDPALVSLLDATFRGHRMNEKDWVWPREWMKGDATALERNAAINEGLKRFLNGARKAATRGFEDLKLLKALRDQLKEWEKAEGQFWAMPQRIKAVTSATDEKGKQQLTEDFSTTQDKLKERTSQVEKSLKDVRQRGLFPGADERLASAYESLFKELEGYKSRTETLLKEIKDFVELPDVKQREKIVAYRLFPQVRSELEKLLEELKKTFGELLTEVEKTELHTLDESHLIEPLSRYETRSTLYHRTLEAFLRVSRKKVLIGTKWKPLSDERMLLDELDKDVAKFEAGTLEKVNAPKARKACESLLSKTRAGLGVFHAAWYYSDAWKFLDDNLVAPLVRPWDDTDSNRLDMAGLRRAGSTLRQMNEDLEPALEEMQKFEPGSRQPLDELRKKTKSVQRVVDALLTKELQPRTMKIVLPPKSTQDAKNGPGSLFAGRDFKSVVLRLGQPPACRNSSDGPPISITQSNEAPLGQIGHDVAFHFHFYPHVGDFLDVPLPAPWTAINLLWEPRSFSSDGKVWYCAVTPKPTGEYRTSRQADLWLFVELQFDAPFPQSDEWPTREKLGFGKKK